MYEKICTYPRCGCNRDTVAGGLCLMVAIFGKPGADTSPNAKCRQGEARGCIEFEGKASPKCTGYIGKE